MTPGAAAHICGVVPKGPVRTYNRSVDVMEQIMPGDYLVSVNGETRNGQPILDAIDSAESYVEVEIWRPRLWTAVVKKLSEYEPMGITMIYGSESKLPVVSEVRRGAVMKHNDANPEMAVQAQDRILAVNGKSGDPGLLTCLLLGDANPMELLLSRPICPHPVNFDAGFLNTDVDDQHTTV